MEERVLNDPEKYPDDAILKEVLGGTFDVWSEFQGYLKEAHPGFEGQWRYYRDGKSWLFKLMKKKKTISWISVWPDYFKTTFYFPERAEGMIQESDLSPEVIERCLQSKRIGKTRGWTINVHDSADLESTKILITLKEAFK